MDGPGPHGALYGLKKPLSISPAKGRAGDQVKLDFDCRYREDDNGGPAISSAVLTADVTKKTAVVKNVKPGKYKVTLSCWIDKSTVTFEVLPPKGQVAKVPAGAPQTGGTEGPADHAGVLAAVAGGLALVVGGVGTAAYRRRADRA
ncbi:hypothetical protein [Amycolatopsis sp. lyj-90]|uniref:hypothetical protein n=1 Tax=Amycolatopsis sp. lyj-90 TaxID=2789285 RepID=UPI00397992FC